MWIILLPLLFRGRQWAEHIVSPMHEIDTGLKFHQGHVDGVLGVGGENCITFTIARVSPAPGASGNRLRLLPPDGGFALRV
ncbi:hypothetical protein BDY21DRAFT_131308 [Lineolata rhizophorae]|uniref:Uncharacterized protein n=1 Tax=Lineolata rhizophorae TaxID=578093 RepID=A0A6A6PAC6_9PEZI|nr:hypothetical protein BDY21DRAFT_131308 [Lineolata rhizophorae]